MRPLSEVMLIGCVGLVLGLAMPAGATHEGCPDASSVRVGLVCLDKYEASLWLIVGPPYTMTENAAIARIRDGTVTLALLKAAGARQLGLRDDLADIGCLPKGSFCEDVYAVSIKGVAPARFVTWFQAAAAARNSWKRLPTNAEWQAGALGTPDPAEPGPDDCNTNTELLDVTGNRPHCVSDRGAFDMVGNLLEWVADWVPRSTGEPQCEPWTIDEFTRDINCLRGAATSGPPGAINRGGSFQSFEAAGVFAVSGLDSPLFKSDDTGFRAVSTPK